MHATLKFHHYALNPRAVKTKDHNALDVSQCSKRWFIFSPCCLHMHHQVDKILPFLTIWSIVRILSEPLFGNPRKVILISYILWKAFTQNIPSYVVFHLIPFYSLLKFSCYSDLEKALSPYPLQPFFKTFLHYPT